MNRISLQQFVHILLFACIRGQQQQETHDSSIILTSHPGNSVFSVGDNVTILCRVDYTRTGGDTLQWYRSQGLVKELIGSRMNRAREFSNSRYIIDLIETSDKSATYQLKINSLRLEDSSTIECHSLSLRKATWPLIICTDPWSEGCQCMVHNGWPSPDCFSHYLETKSAHNRYRNAVIVLSIALFLLVIISIILCVLLVRDCVARIRYWRDKTEASQPLAPNINIPPLDHVRAPPSALKIHRPPPGQGLHGVKFSDGTSSAGNISGSGSLGFTDRFSGENFGGNSLSPREPQVYGSPGVVMSPIHLDSSYGFQEPKEGYQSPNQVPYGSYRNINLVSAGTPDIYGNAGISGMYSYNQPGNPSVYPQLENPNVAAAAQYNRPVEMGNSGVMYNPPNYSQVFSGYADQMVANNLNTSMPLLGGQFTTPAVPPSNQSNKLSSSSVALHTGSRVDLGSTDV